MRAITALLFTDGASNSTNSSNTTSINKNKRILSNPKARSFIHTLEEMMSSLSRSTQEMTSSFTSSNRGWKFCCFFISMGCRLSSRSSIHGFTTWFSKGSKEPKGNCLLVCSLNMSSDCRLSRKGTGSARCSSCLPIKNQATEKNLSILSTTSLSMIPNASKSPQKFPASSISASETIKSSKWS